MNPTCRQEGNLGRMKVVDRFDTTRCSGQGNSGVCGSVAQSEFVVGAAPAAERGALVRQAKLGASCRVQVPAEYGLTNHSCRVLHLLRR